MKDFFISDEKHIQKERARARDLRKTSWWRQKIQKGVCHYCNQSFSSDQLTMDHQVPLARGGKTGKNNIVVCCKTCNIKKSHKNLIDIRLKKSPRVI